MQFLIRLEMQRIQRSSYDMLGEDVLIAGAGPIGIMAAAIAKFSGARHVVITDFNQYRLDLAMKLGATKAVNLGRKIFSM